VDEIDIRFERDTIMNANDKAQQELTEAQAKRTQIETLVTLEPYIGDDELLKQACDILELDYDEVMQSVEEVNARAFEGEGDLIAENEEDEQVAEGTPATPETD